MDCRAAFSCRSLFFKRYRAEYYRRLNALQLDGDWEGWRDFFLDGVAIIAEETVAPAREVFAVVAADRARVLALEGSSIFAARLFEPLPTHPIVTTASVVQLLATTKLTATRAIEALVQADVLTESTGRKRDRSFAYRRQYVDCLKIGTELEKT